MKACVVAMVTWFAAASAHGQVGYPPSQSPFRDLEFRQELTFFTGYFAAHRDPAGVAPQSGPIIGARYEVRIGGPAQLTARVAHVFSQRTVLDPAGGLDNQVIGTRSWPLYLADVGISLNVTGQKSYRGFVPVLGFGLGVASDFRTSGDAGGYRFGTPFALSFGAGVRYTPRGPFQLRLDLSDHLYTLRYPNSYFTAFGGNPPIHTGSQSFWTHNAAIALGASYQFFR